MKKTAKWIVAFAAACVIVLAGCENGNEPDPITVQSVTIDPAGLTLALGATEKLTAAVLPENADDKTVAWSSSDDTVAIVCADGTVAALKEGTATITAKAGGKQATCEVTVIPVGPAEYIHYYREGICTVCGFSKPTMDGGTIDDEGVLTKYTGSEPNVVIPEGVRKIAGNAFYNNTSLTSVTIPDSVKSIGNNNDENGAFEGCTRLASVTIPASVESIGVGVFEGCTNLKTVTYKGTLAEWCAMNNDAYCMLYAETVTMSDVTDLKTMSTLEIPDGVTNVGIYAFYGCGSLTSVRIPNGVTHIKNGAFRSCTNFDSITIPDSVTEISGGAFRECTRLKSVTIGTSVKRIDMNVFNEFTNLATVTYKGTKAQWEAITKDTSWNSRTGDFIIYCTADGTKWNKQGQQLGEDGNVIEE